MRCLNLRVQERGNSPRRMIAFIGVALLAASCGGNADDKSVGAVSSMALAGETSLWPDNTVPTGFAYADSGSIELGVKFKSAVGGTVTGIRFYKGDGNTGTHVGNLWTASGTRLASAVFSQETPTGWQTARFSAPVTIQPDTIYVASYFAPNGRYAGVGGYFTASGRSAPPLYAFKDGEQGGNGVYARATTSTFPSSTFNANNYYVDVLFAPAGTSGSGDPRWFRFVAETTGSNPTSWAQVLADRFKFTGFGMWVPIPASAQTFIQSTSHSLSAFMPAVNRNMPAYAYTYDPAKTQTLENTLRALTTSDPSKIFWNGMPEFDQSGGDWAQGRPIPSPSLTRQQNYEQFRNHYLNTLGIGSYIGRTREQRGYSFAAVSDYPWTAHWAYEWGADLVLGERAIDELSGMVPGASFYRGAGRQFGKPWGFDLSTWRYWTSSPTEYDSNNRLTGGWSSSWFKRHLYLAYMAGANAIHMEPAVYFSPSGALNPFGSVVAQFTDFALVRHRNRPPEHVPFALVVDRYSGFDAKFGQYMQGNSVWHARLPYSSGDYMLNNVLRMAYPDHWLHGTLVPGGPQSVSEYRARLAAGEDPRPWEPMGKSRWGDVFNVLNNATTVTGLGKHRVAMLTTHTPADGPLRSNFWQFVQAGGVLILNAAQVTAEDAALTGASLTGQTAQSTSSSWIADGTSFTEPAYTYARLNLQGATVVARNNEGAPLITRYAVGAGEVYLTTPTLLQDNNRTQILNIGRKLFDVLNDRYAPAKVSGPSILYQINTDGRVTTVTLHNGGGTWTGTVSFPAPAGTFRTTEWTSDTAVAYTVGGGRVSISASVPPYEVRIYTLENTTP